MGRQSPRPPAEDAFWPFVCSPTRDLQMSVLAGQFSGPDEEAMFIQTLFAGSDGLEAGDRKSRIFEFGGRILFATIFTTDAVEPATKRSGLKIAIGFAISDHIHSSDSRLPRVIDSQLWELLNNAFGTSLPRDGARHLIEHFVAGGGTAALSPMEQQLRHASAVASALKPATYGAIGRAFRRWRRRLGGGVETPAGLGRQPGEPTDAAADDPVLESPQRGASMPFISSRLRRSHRNFLRELVVVVAGVVIALVLQAMASDWREARRSGAMRASMGEEIADFAEMLRIRQLATPCIADKLAQIEAALDGPESGPWTNVGRPSYFFSSQGAWNGAAADLLATQLPHQTFRLYGEIYQGMGQYDLRGQREQEHWIVLQSLERQDEPVVGERRWRLLEAIEGARSEGLVLNAIAAQATRLAKDLGVSPSGSLARLDVKATALCRRLAKAES
jgi:hypothetical protein